MSRRLAVLGVGVAFVAGISCNEHSPFEPNHLKVALAINATISKAVSSSARELDLIVWYHRVTANSDVQIIKQPYSLQDTTTQEKADVDIADCLADKDREQATDVPAVCVLHVALRLLNAAGVLLDSESLAPIVSKPGVATQTPAIALGTVVGSVAVSPRTLTLNALGFTSTLTATVKDTSGATIANPSVSWTSLGSAVTVDTTGKVTAAAVGTAKVVAASRGKADTATITVQQVPKTIALTGGRTTLVVGDTTLLKVSVVDSNSTPMSASVVGFTSNNTRVATVNATSGLVQANDTGTAVITAAAAPAQLKITITVQLAGLGLVSSVTVTPNPDTVVAGATAQMSVTLKDVGGNVLTGKTVTWSSSDTTKAKVSSSGLVTAIAPGTLAITASSGGAFGSATVVVKPNGVGIGVGIASIKITPNLDTIRAGDTLALTATFVDASGNQTPITPVWATSQPFIAQVAPTGQLIAYDTGTVTISASYNAVAGHATIVVTPAPFASTSAGVYFTCGLKTTGEAFCWGYNGNGQLGDGTNTSRSAPMKIGGGLAFQTIAVANSHVCGLSGGQAFCWGYNGNGQLGDGTTTSRTTPTAVAGGLTFTNIAVGDKHSCGLTSAGVVYCWGYNGSGEIGDSTTTSRLTPTKVAGGLTFQSLGTGHGDTQCAVATSGAAYCWGYNSYGEVGDSTTTSKSVPTAVHGGLTFKSLSIGFYHVCGVSTSGAAYCWGYNGSGQIGDGTTTQRLTPTAVTGGLTFAGISAGYNNTTCGFTSAGAGYCWGYNGDGEFGNGSSSSSLTPTAVGGSLVLQNISTGRTHSCGVTTAHAAYCWGDNSYGGVGDGTTTSRLSPVTVHP